MKLKALVMILLLNCCTTNFTNKDLKKEIIFSEEMSFDEFKHKLVEYAINSDYPNIKD